MADMQSFLVFVRYDKEFERSKCVVLPRRWGDSFQEYDDAKFHQHFRRSLPSLRSL